MHTIQQNEDHYLQYLLKLIPDFSVFDIIEKHMVTKTKEVTGSNEDKIEDLCFYYNKNYEYLNDNSNSRNREITISTENNKYYRCIFKFSFEKTQFIEENHVSGYGAVEIKVGDITYTNIDSYTEEEYKFILKLSTEDKKHTLERYELLKSDGLTPVTDNNGKIILTTINDIRNTDIVVKDISYNYYIIKKANDFYLIIIDELKTADGKFNIYIKDYRNNPEKAAEFANLQSVIGVCF